MQPQITRIVALTALAATLGACPENNGTDPPTDKFFYPAALALHRDSADADADFLYVVNSDFDLAYNGSNVMAVDLDRVRTVRRRLAAIDATCRAAAVASPTDPPGRECTAAAFTPDVWLPLRLPEEAPPNDPKCHRDADASGAWICPDTRLVVAGFTRKVNPYAVEATLAVYPNGAQRLYTIVRGGNTLTWFDVGNDGALDCGPRDERDYCAGSHSTGSDGAQSDSSRLLLPQETSALSVDTTNGYIVMTHQGVNADTAHASFLVDPNGGTATTQSAGPRLLSTLGGTATGLCSLVLLPRANPGDRSTWLATSRTEAAFTLLQAYAGNEPLSDHRQFLYRAASAPVLGLNTGTNNRTIVLDPRPGASARTAYVVSRSPEALLTVDISNPAVPTVTDAIALPAGPSRAAAVWLPALGRTYVYTASYDARWIYVVDPSEHRVVDQIATNRGPHNMVHDAREGLLYVVDFLDSTVEVIDVCPTARAGDVCPAAAGAENAMFNRRVLTFGRTGRNTP